MTPLKYMGLNKVFQLLVHTEYIHRVCWFLLFIPRYLCSKYRNLSNTWEKKGFLVFSPAVIIFPKEAKIYVFSAKQNKKNAQCSAFVLLKFS